jgi:hypothetical protein
MLNPGKYLSIDLPCYVKDHYRDLDVLVINYILKMDDFWVYQDMSEFANTVCKILTIRSSKMNFMYFLFVVVFPNKDNFIYLHGTVMIIHSIIFVI